MITKQQFKDKVNILYYEDSTKITNSYLLNDEEIEKVASLIEFSRHCKYDWKCIYLRNQKSYIQEIKAHNRLYNLGIFKTHTIDTDLNEQMNILEKFIYWLIGR